MDKKQNDSRRCAIVRQFVAGIADDTEWQVCSLYQYGFDDEEVKRRLRLSWCRLTAIKLKLAIELGRAGIHLPKEA